MKLDFPSLCVGVVIVLTLVITVPHMMFGMNFKGDRYEIPKVVASSPVQQQTQE